MMLVICDEQEIFIQLMMTNPDKSLCSGAWIVGMIKQMSLPLRSKIVSSTESISICISVNVPQWVISSMCRCLQNSK
jgi:hypothetical protein